MSEPRNSTRTYMTWKSMRKRCTNKNHKHYKYYGGRGIKICKRWDDYNNFLSDMGERPLGLTIDRKDNNGNYEPKNCQWATRSEQQKNSSNAKKIIFNGKMLCVREWEEHLGLSRGGLWHRLKNGWSIEKALSIQPLKSYKP